MFHYTVSLKRFTKLFRGMFLHCVQELSQVKQAYDCCKVELEKVKAESHKRKKIIATQQLVMQNGKEAYNKVYSQSVISSIAEI